jgi:hypothetical protein
MKQNPVSNHRINKWSNVQIRSSNIEFLKKYTKDNYGKATLDEILVKTFLELKENQNVQNKSNMTTKQKKVQGTYL